MEYQKCLNHNKELYDFLFKFIEDENEYEYHFQNLINQIEFQNITERREELELFIFLLIEISRNYHRYPNFINKINQIIQHYESNIKQTFTNSEIFNMLKNNKIILLFFINRETITIDQNIVSLILENDDKYFSFFLLL